MRPSRSPTSAALAGSATSNPYVVALTDRPASVEGRVDAAEPGGANTRAVGGTTTS